MKKLTTALSSVALLLTVVGVVSAKPNFVTGNWELTAPSAISFQCGGGTYNHTLTDVTNQNGEFEGVGNYDANNAYTWDFTGEIVGDDITFNIFYTGVNPGYNLDGVGTIAADGSIIGTTNGNCQNFEMPAGTAERFEGNHGQYVRMSENKKEAAQSRVGMPAKSKGHTK